MVQARNDTSWQLVNMPEFLNYVDLARNDSKHLFVWDKNGICAQLAQFSGAEVYDFNLEQ